jgi:hypothetical protein
MLRDSALAASGLLVETIGGPPAHPYQAPGSMWKEINNFLPEYKADKGAGLYRRSLYTFWRRTTTPPNMTLFDTTTREVCSTRRMPTNTPLQALVMLNDPQFVEAARRLSETLLQNHPGNPSSLLQDLAERVLARPVRSPELTILTQSYQDLLAHYQAQPADAQALITVGDSKPSSSLNPAELAAWTMVCNQVMNLDEALNK